MSHHRYKSIQAKDLRPEAIVAAYHTAKEEFGFVSPWMLHAILDGVSPVEIPMKVLLAKLRKMQSTALRPRVFSDSSCFCGCGSPMWLEEELPSRDCTL